jgi:hypothetical protein
MPTRKQRRRRQKGRRHEYEYVYVDEEGNELDVDEQELKPEAAPSRNGRTRSRAPSAAPRIPPPSWRRVGKRGLIFAPLMFVTVMLLGDDLAWWQWVVQTGWLLAIFLPFSYFVDSFMYRRYVKRTRGDSGAAKRG